MTLVTQEHETVSVQINCSGGAFDRQVLYQAPDSAYGSGGIELTDMDGDSDTDVVPCNGDTFDDHIPKPFQAVPWLENTGTYPFGHHVIATIPRVHRAIPGDIDLDGDDKRDRFLVKLQRGMASMWSRASSGEQVATPATRPARSQSLSNIKVS